jgi:hypothetical protein
MSEQPDTRERLCRATERAAIIDVADLVKEARTEARARVHAILVDAFAENLLELAETELRRGAPERRAPTNLPRARNSSRRDADPSRDEAVREGASRASAGTARRSADACVRTSVEQGSTVPGTPAGEPSRHRSSTSEHFAREPIAPAPSAREPSTGKDSPSAPSAREPSVSEPSASERDPQDPDSVGCYVYGVVGAQAALTPGASGLEDVHEVFLIDGDSVAAVVSRVSLDEFGEEALKEHLDDLSWLERQARRHEQILGRVREQTTLVPMRLCTIYRDERSVREMLAREQTFLIDALDRLEGRTEWGIKIYAVSDPGDAPDEDASGNDALGEASGETPDETRAPGPRAQDKTPGPGASYLMQRRLREHRRECAEALMLERCELAHRELAQAAVEAKLNPVQPRELTGRDEPMVFNGVYLVEDAKHERFTSVVRALESDLAENGLELELTGPWTPYNFVGSPTEDAQ